MRGALQLFVKTFLGFLGALLAIVLVFGGIGLFSSQPQVGFRNPTTFIYNIDGYGNQTIYGPKTPVILRFDIDREIGTGALTGENIQIFLQASRRGIFQGRVKGIFLYIDTPGGSVNDTDQIYLALKQYKEKFKIPIYAFVNGLCASGGMYIASVADQIYTTDISKIGSVGVIIRPFFNVSNTLEKIGVTTKTFKQGKDKDSMSPFRPWTATEGSNIEHLTAKLYERFLNVVTAGRPRVSKEALRNEYGAHMFLAQEAKQLGFVDEVGFDYFSTMTALSKKAGIPQNAPYQVMQIVENKSIIERVFQQSQHAMQSLTMRHQIDWQQAPEAKQGPAYLMAP